MKITITGFDPKTIVNQYGIDAKGNTQLYTANRAFQRMQKYVPFDTGALSTTVTIKPGSVTYEVPYAHRQYVSNKGKRLRGKYWDKKMWTNEGKMLTQEVQNYARKMKG